jgi:hypothetical protein
VKSENDWNRWQLVHDKGGICCRLEIARLKPLRESCVEKREGLENAKETNL